MLSRSKLIFFGLLLLECAACVVVGSFFYRRYQQAQEQERAQYIVRLNQDTIQATKFGGLQYYYEPKPDSINSESPSWLGYANVQTYNHDGLNERFDYPVGKTPDTLRIIAVGDSFTHGDFVSTEKNWTELLEDALNHSGTKLCGKQKIEVINLGMSGYDVEYIAQRYRTSGVKYNPDIIVWFESGSGFYRLSELTEPLIRACREKTSTMSADVVSDEEKLRHEYQCWDTAARTIKNTYSPDKIRTLLNENYQKFFQSASQLPVLIFTYQDPSDDQISAMAQFLHGHAMAQFLPIVPSLTSQTRLPDGHPSLAGHQVIEQVILQELLKKGSEICPVATSSAELQ